MPFGSLDLSVLAAVEHPVWLGVGTAIGLLAALLGSLSLAILGTRHGGSSALAAFGVIFLAFAAAGAVLISVLEFALIAEAEDGVLEAVLFRQRWDWWNALGWVLFWIGGLIALLAIGIGIARGNPALRYPALSLAASAVLVSVFPAVGAALFALALVWIASALARVSPGPERDVRARQSAR